MTELLSGKLPTNTIFWQNPNRPKREFIVDRGSQIVKDGQATLALINLTSASEILNPERFPSIKARNLAAGVIRDGPLGR